MKQALTFTPPILSSTESKLNVEAFDASVEAFENHEYLKSFYALLDYINGDFRTKYGNVQGNEFHIPHGSIIVNIKLDEEKLSITAPFVALPEKGRIPLLRQVAGLNFNAMDLATIYLRDNRLSFEYSCPIQLINPYKIYYILQEICCTGDKYDDEFETKFGAQRIYEPKTTPYDTASLENIYQAVQISCKECLDAVKYFEPSRKYGYIWNIIDTTLMKFMYFAQPQGQLLNDMQKAIREMDREDIPLPEITAQGKAVVKPRYFNYLHIHCRGVNLLARREAKDIWQNLYEYPLIETGQETELEVLQQTPAYLELMQEAGEIQILRSFIMPKHVLSHRIIYARFYEIEVERFSPAMQRFLQVPEEELEQYAVSRLIALYREK